MLNLSWCLGCFWQSSALYKLRKCGVGGTLFKWFESYLSGRKQRVVINGKSSTWAKIFSGVPQGSILGPFLFLIYFDDIIKDIESDMFLFADDASILDFFKNSYDSSFKLNRDLIKLHDWSKKWFVEFNPTKTKFLVFSKKK